MDEFVEFNYLLLDAWRGDIVWEFVNPYIPSPRYKGAVFKRHFYPRDHCDQFKDLPRD